MKRLGLLLLCVSVVACPGVTSPSVGLGQEFTPAPNERIRIAGVNTTVTFVGVEADSRCPANALCIQGGDALVNIAVASPGNVGRYALHTGNLRPVTHQGLIIALVQLSPYPFSSSPIRPSDYRATLAVTR